MTIKIFHDDFGNTATITERNMLPYKGSPIKEKGYILSITADYDNNFLYFVSVYESMGDAMEKLKMFSCNTWKAA
jgi:hypothetical protein